MEEEINLLDYWRVLVRRKRLIGLIVVCVTLISILYSLLAPKIYRAEASLLPIEGEKSANIASAIAQTGLGAFLGGLSGTGSSATTLMAVLKSRTLAERVIEKMDLMKVFFEPLDIYSLEAAVNILRGKVTFQEDKTTTLIKISGEFKDPELAARIVNTFINELTTYLAENELTLAKRNRVFIERQLEKNKVLLLQTGKEISQFYGNKQISSIDSSLDVDVSINTIKGNPLSPTDKEQLARLEEEQSTLEKKLTQARLVKAVPQQVYLQYLTSYYQLLRQMNTLLTQQYETAKIDEAREAVSFEVIDWARVPEKRFKPKRRQIVMVAFTASLFMAMFIAFFLDYLEKMKKRAIGEGQ